MQLRFTIPSTLAMTLLCSCHTGGQHPSDAPDNVTPIADARTVSPDAADALLADAAVTDAPIMLVDAGIDASPDAAMIDAFPDADLA